MWQRKFKIEKEEKLNERFAKWNVLIHILRSAIKYMKYIRLDNHEAQIRRPKHMEMEKV